MATQVSGVPYFLWFTLHSAQLTVVHSSQWFRAQLASSTLRQTSITTMATGLSSWLQASVTKRLLAAALNHNSFNPASIILLEASIANRFKHLAADLNCHVVQARC